MSEREQFQRLARRLSGEKVRLQRELCRAERECRQLRCANANLLVERDAADVLLGEAMDRLLEESRR
jgi:hypothetical protein